MKFTPLRLTSLHLFAGLLFVWLSLLTSPLALFAQSYAYVANQLDSTVSVISIPNNTVVATVSGLTDPVGVAITPDGTRAYVANYVAKPNGTVSVIDTSSNAVVATVPGLNGPLAIAITPDGKRAYVTSGAPNGPVWVIDTSSNSVLATIPVGYTSSAVAITPDGTRAYVGSYQASVVSVIDTSSNTVIATVLVGNSPSALAITPDGTRAYAGNLFDNTVSVISTSSNTVVATVPGLSEPYGMAITPDGSRAYVANIGGATVSVIDTSSNTVIATVPVGNSPSALAITPDGTRAYVPNKGGNTVSVIDTSSNTVVATVPVGSNPAGVAITPSSSCTASIFPSSESFGLAGGIGSFSVNIGQGCSWTTQSNAKWIKILSSGHQGPGVVTFAVASSTGSRSGTITAGGQTFTAIQQGSSCTYTISPMSAAPDDTAQTISVSVTAPQGCSWTAVSHAAWITVQSGSSGTGGGAVDLAVAANPNQTQRSGTATIAGNTFTVTQGGGACGVHDVTSKLQVVATGLTLTDLVRPYEFSQTLYFYWIGFNFQQLYMVLQGIPNHQQFPNDNGLLSPPWTYTHCFSSQGDVIFPIRPPYQSTITNVQLLFYTENLSTSLNYSFKILDGYPLK